MCCLVHTGTYVCIQKNTCVPRNAVTCPAGLGSHRPLPVTPFSRQQVNAQVNQENLLPRSTELLSLHN